MFRAPCSLPFKLALVGIAAAGIAFTETKAQVIEWTSTTDTDWFDYNNWLTELVPGTVNTVTIGTGGTAEINGSSAMVEVVGVSVSNGKLRVHDGDLATTSGVSLGADGILEIDGGTLGNATNSTLSSSVTGVAGSELIFNGVGGGTFDDLISGTLDLIVQAGTTTLTAANTFSGELNQSSGTLILDEDHTFTAGTLTGGRLRGAGDITFSGDVAFTQFYFDGPGSTTLAGTSTINRTGTSAYRWIDVEETATVENTGTFNITDTGAHGNDAYIYLRGDSTGDAQFINRSAGTLNLHTGASASDIVYIDGSNRNYDHFVNEGTLNITSAGSGFAHADGGVTFDNNGVVNVLSGRLEIAGGSNGTTTGDYAVSDGAKLEFTASTTELGATASISGDGTLTLSGATLDATPGADLSIANLQLTSGTLRGSADITFAGDIDFHQFYFESSGTTTLTGTSTINRTGSESYNWFEVEQNATVENSGTLNVTDTGNSTSDAHIYLRGDSTGDAVFTNLSTGTVNFHTGANSADETYVDGGNRNYDHFVNDGTINVSTDGAGSTKFDAGVSFDNDGTLNLQSGNLSVAGGTHNGSTGDFVVSDGATLEFAGNTSDFTSTASISGAGTTEFSSGTANFATGAALTTTGLVISGGTVNLADDHTFGDATLSSGRLAGEGDITFSGDVAFTQFYFDGPGSTTLAGTSTINRTGTSAYRWIDVEETATVENTGTFNITDTGAHGNDAYIYLRGDSTGDAQFINRSAGTLNLHTGASASDIVYIDGSNRNYDHFVNEGTLNITSAGSGFAHADGGVTFDNNGVVNVLSGRLEIAGGSNGTTTGDYAVSDGAKLEFTASTTELGATSSISGDGTLTLSGATLNAPAGADLSIANLQLTSGTLGGSGDLTLSGDASFYRFTFAGTGVKTLTGVSSVYRSGTNASEYINVSAGTELRNSGTLTFSDLASYHYGDVHLHLNGKSSGDAVFRNLAGGTFTTYTEIDHQDRVFIDGDGTANSFFYNEGTFNVTSDGTSSYTQIDSGTSFANSGQVNVTGGKLLVDGGDGGSTTGDFAISDGARLEFNGGTYTFESTASVTGEGTFEIAGATVDVLTGATISPDGLFLDSGTMGGSGDLMLGDVSINKFTFADSGIKTLTGTTSVYRSSSVTSDYINVSAGTELRNSGTLNLSDVDTYHYGDVYVNLNGTSSGNAVLRNLAGGVINTYTEIDHEDRVFFDGDGTTNSFFYNEGTLNVTSDSTTGYTQIDSGTTFVNSGQVNVTGGKLFIDGGDGGSTTGDFAISDGARLDFNSGTYSLASTASITGEGTLEISGATVDTATGTSLDIDNLFLNSGTLGGSGDLTLPGSVSIDRFTFADSGIKILAGSSSVYRSSTNSSEYINVSAGTELRNSGTLNLSDVDSYHYSDVYLNLNGNSSGNAVFRNMAGAVVNTYTETDHQDRVFFDGDGISNSFFYNEGTLNVTSDSTTGYTQIDSGTTFVNSGQVNVTGGKLIIDGGDGGSTTGDFAVSDGARLNFNSGTYSLASTASITGEGTLEISGATLNTASGSTLDTDNLFLNTGTLGGAGDTTLTGDVAFYRFTFADSGIKTLAGSSSVHRSSTNSSEYINVSAGTELRNSGTFTLSDLDDYTYQDVYLNLNGTSGGHAVFRNTSAGTVTTFAEGTGRDRVRIDGDGTSTSFFYNEGTFNVTSEASGQTIIENGTTFVNSGQVNVTGGTLYMNGSDGGSTSGDFSVASGGRIFFDSGTYNLGSTASISGAGTLEISGGTLNTLSGAEVSVDNLTLYTGTLGGSGDLTLSGDADFYQFNFAGEGIKTLAGNSSLHRSSTNTFEYIGVSAGTELRNSGTLTLSDLDNYTYQDVYLALNGTGSGNAVFRNTSAGTVTTFAESTSLDRVVIDGDGTSNSYFYNEGTFNVTSDGSGQTRVDGGMTFENSGTIDIKSGSLVIDGIFNQTAGSLLLNGGSLTKTGSDLNIAGGTLGGTGTITGNVSFTGGELAPGLSPGTLNINGDLVLYSGSLFTIEIGGLLGGTQYDKINVTGDLDLTAATIQLSFINNFTPSASDTFNFFTVGGSFSAAANVEVTGLQPGWSFDTNFSSGVFSLNSLSNGFTAVPEPSTAALLLTGGLVLLMRRPRRRA